MEYRPLEGFVLAVTPQSFTALVVTCLPCCNVRQRSGMENLPIQVYSAQMFMRILQEAGLPDGNQPGMQMAR